MSGIIYHAFDTSNGMGYVGQTIQLFNERLKGHRKPKCKMRVSRAYKKRPNDFVWTILCEVCDEDLNTAETSFIRELGTLHPSGYNMMEGGRGGRKSAETRRKMSEAAMGHPPARTTYKKGQSSFWKGKKLSSEHAAKIAAGKRRFHECP